jgi:hypothetical protein
LDNFSRRRAKSFLFTFETFCRKPHSRNFVAKLFRHKHFDSLVQSFPLPQKIGEGGGGFSSISSFLSRYSFVSLLMPLPPNLPNGAKNIFTILYTGYII